MVMEDSSHRYDHTLAVLRAYSTIVTPGSLLIVEDTICHHGSDQGPKPGPYEAVEAFLAEGHGRDFEIDLSRERYLITWPPHGYLRRRP
ncbi:MAG: CmcI family methyltransferase [Kiritimatiellia bacterium]|jgi:cephalosporin hydroxylase|nr:CmcI family methyltransferase [Kiritimatiellia bacterium]